MRGETSVCSICWGSFFSFFQYWHCPQVDMINWNPLSDLNDFTMSVENFSDISAKKSLYSVHTLRLSGRTSSGLILASSAVEISRIGAMAASWGYWRFNKSTTMVKINWIFKKIHECCKQIVSVYKIFRDTVHSVIQRWALARLSRCYGNILVKSTIVLIAR